jgi:hypothetical protein
MAVHPESAWQFLNHFFYELADDITKQAIKDAVKHNLNESCEVDYLQEGLIARITTADQTVHMVGGRVEL